MLVPCALRAPAPVNSGVRLNRNEARMLAGPFFVALYFYPIWGFALLFVLCSRLRPLGSIANRIRAAIVISSIATFTFGPVMWGAEGFGMMLPWYLGLLFDKAHVIVVWQLVVFVFVAAFVINLMPGKNN
jgi:hypothetical protein